MYMRSQTNFGGKIFNLLKSEIVETATIVDSAITGTRQNRSPIGRLADVCGATVFTRNIYIG